MNISDKSVTKALIANAAVEVAINNPEKFPSVSEICEKAHIDRSTFYYHFKSIEDLFSSIELNMLSDIASTCFDLTDNGFNERFFVPYLRLLKEKQILYKVIISQVKVSTERNVFLDFLYDRFRNLCIQKGLDDETIRQIFIYSQTGCYGCIKNWVQKGCKESEEEVSKFLYECAVALINGPFGK